MKRSVFLLLLALTPVAWSVPMILRVPEMTQQPKLDGAIDPLEWRNAVEMVDAVDHEGRAIRRKANFRIAQDADNWYFAFQRETGPDGRLLNRARNGQSSMFRLDDLFEVELVPPGESRLYRYAVNGSGIAHARSYPLAMAAPMENQAEPWPESNRIKTQSALRNGVWVLEMTLPKKIFPNAGTQGEIWRIQLHSHFRRPAESGGMQYEKGTHFVEDMPTIIPDRAAPAVSMARLDRQNYVLEVRNVSQLPLRSRLQTRSGQVSAEHDVYMKPGESRRFPIEIANDKNPGAIVVNLRDTSGKGTYFRRSVKPLVPQSFTPPAQEKLQETLFRHMWIPSESRLVGGIDKAPLKSQVTWRILASDGKVKDRAVTNVDDRGNAAWQVQPADKKMTEGDYTLEATVATPTGERIRHTGKFTIKHFEWAGNTSGVANAVPMPYRALRRDKDGIHAANSRIRLAGNGLPLSITTGNWPEPVDPADRKQPDDDEDKAKKTESVITFERLSDPVRLFFNGRALTGTALPAQLLSPGPQRMRFSGGQDGALATVRTKSAIDFDGVIRCDLSITPKQRLQGPLELVIPIPESYARTLRAVSGATNGSKVFTLNKSQDWNSFQAERIVHSPGNLLPYLHIGDDRHGLAVFVKGGQDRHLNGKMPAWQLRHNSKGYELRCLLAQSLRPGQTLDYTIGLQPTPVRQDSPVMRSIADNWTPWPNVQLFRTLRHPGNWGAFDPRSLEPVNADYSLLERIGKAQHHSAPDDSAFAAAFVAKYAKSLTRPAQAALRRTVQEGLDAAIGADKLLIQLRAGALDPKHPAGQVYRDEWLKLPRQSVGEGTIHPGRSYRDYYLAQVEKLLTSGVDGVELNRLETLSLDDIFATRELLLRLNLLLAGHGRFLQEPVAKNAVKKAGTEEKNMHQDQVVEIVDGKKLRRPKNQYEQIQDRKAEEEKRKKEQQLSKERAARLAQDRPLLVLDSPELLIAPYASLAAMVLDCDKLPHDMTSPGPAAERNGAIPISRFKVAPRELLRASRVATAWSILHNRPLVATDNNLGSVFTNTWRELYRFGYGEADMRVTGSLTDKDFPITASDKRFAMTLFRRADAKDALLAVINTGKSASGTLNLTKLKMPNAVVTDVLGNTTLPMQKNIITLTLPEYDFKLLRISFPEPTDEEEF